LLRTGHAGRMGKKRHILVIALLVAVFGAISWQVLCSRETTYQGKGQTAWLKDLNSGPIIQGDFSGEKHEAAADAFRRMGTNALPQLLDGLRSKDSRLALAWMNVSRKYPVFGRIFLPADERRSAAAQAFKSLGPIAEPAIPELTSMLNDPDTSLESAFCLASIGSNGIPPLIQALTNYQPKVRYCAVFALGYKPTLAQAVVPTLLRMLSDPDLNVRLAASGTLKSIDPETAAKAGVGPGPDLF